LTGEAALDTSGKPSIAKLILRDYLSLLCFLAPVVNWGMYAAAALGIWRSEPGEAQLKTQFTFWFAAVSTLVCVPLLWWRIGSLRSLLREGILVPGRVTSMWFVKDRGRIDYEYTFDGQTFHGGMAVTKSKRAGEIEKGQEINVLLHPANPSRSTVPDIFG
jgi:hypothetical protein